MSGFLDSHTCNIIIWIAWFIFIDQDDSDRDFMLAIKVQKYQNDAS